MRFSRDLSLVFVFVLCGSLAGLSQSKSPETALDEIAAAEKLDDLAHHLPLAIEENIARLSPMQKAALEEQIVVPHLLARTGQILQKRDNGGWEFQFPGEELAHTIRVKTTFYSGSEALLILERDSQDGMTGLVSMRYEDSEWRVTDFGFLHMMGIESRLQEKLRPSVAEEAEIVSALESIEGALRQYAITYPQIGLPTTLQVLGPDPNAAAEPSGVAENTADTSATDQSSSSDTDEDQSDTLSSSPEQHAGLLDASFMSDPLVLQGYRFRYTLIAAHATNERGRLGQFCITATPVDFGKNGTRSFYVDESSTIRFTDDNRDATANDAPLKRAAEYAYQYWLR